MKIRYISIIAIAGIACGTEPSTQPSEAPRLISIAAGVSETCTVSITAELYCWGSSRLNASEEVSARRVMGPGSVQAIELADDPFFDFGCAMLVSHQALCWGWIRMGFSRYTPLSDTLRTLYNFPFVSDIAVANNHVCGLRLADSTAVCTLGFWSGVGGTGAVVPPRFDTVPAPVVGDIRFTQIVAGDWMTCGLAHNRLVYCWGEERSIGVASPSLDPVATCLGFPCVNRPVQLDVGLQFDHLTAGEAHACALGAPGVYCWGKNAFGQTGQPGAQGNVTRRPARVDIPSPVQISAGLYHTCALSSDGRVYCWGWNTAGQLGRTTSQESDPQPRAVETSVRFRSVSAGAFHTCAIGADQAAYCWGWNASGQLGTGDTVAVAGVVRATL